jgi:hypothetical protein
MRSLTASQKKVIREYVKLYPGTTDYEDLDDETWERLKRINNTEILWMEVNRFIDDLRTEEIVKSRGRW